MIEIQQARKNDADQRKGFVDLVRINAAEAVPRLPFLPGAVERTFMSITEDDERTLSNLWLAKKDESFIGYAMGGIEQFFYNNDFCAFLSFLFVAPAHRGSLAAIKLVKQFEGWARLGGALHIYLGVARLDKDEAGRVGDLFPRLGYEWCGSYFVKETV